MQAKHYALIGGMLAAIGSMGASAHDWSEVFTPSFVFGALGAVGAVITALYTERPNERRQEIARLLAMPARKPFTPYGKKVE